MINRLKDLYYYKYRFKSPKVLARVACLGSEILRREGIVTFANHQKSRIDYLLTRAKNPNIVADYSEINVHLEKKYVLGSIASQRMNFFNYSSPDLIILDSFSELTDQLFERRATGQLFLANYSDIHHSDAFSKVYKCNGLLPIHLLRKYYESFFALTQSKYPKSPIVFINFSTALDSRQKFKERSSEIEAVVTQLSRDYSNLKLVSLHDSEVTHSDHEEDQGFPYHFSESTNIRYSEEFKKVFSL